MSKKIEIKLVRSFIGCPQWMRTIARTLKLRKLQDSVVVPDNAAMRGMVAKIPHLLSVKEL